MKLLIIITLLQFLSSNGLAQISINNTSWDAHTTIPQSIDLRLEFARTGFNFSFEWETC